jgi:hypothetical protein
MAEAASISLILIVVSSLLSITYVTEIDHFCLSLMVFVPMRTDYRIRFLNRPSRLVSHAAITLAPC